MSFSFWWICFRWTFWRWTYDGELLLQFGETLYSHFHDQNMFDGIRCRKGHEHNSWNSLLKRQKQRYFKEKGFVQNKTSSKNRSLSSPGILYWDFLVVWSISGRVRRCVMMGKGFWAFFLLIFIKFHPMYLFFSFFCFFVVFVASFLIL